MQIYNLKNELVNLEQKNYKKYKIWVTSWIG